ncbi:spindle assembly checkpoint component mad1 isoform X1 [Zea mays]|uniref:Myosin heavy chain-related protein n=1 Tax=Zea mays TaxID=4577 RepID=A0A1D6GNH0_MAIZE|nr:spindle assembly checkpoint component mad1 isoform X1 [Zea mays]AQK64787.1 Myosin heavy chain-related protein [Zea mays]|eukprot:XP_008644735.1 spindle assembly checkpoint component mad1 isoform X1 [Zea mays]
MFKSRWRGGRAKAVFKLQFHATQVPELGWEAMVVVVTPQDAGRPTARSEPAEVTDGACRWAAPVMEATKLPTGKDKIYQFLVYETGSSKAALLGEATVNLAEYADALKPSVVTLPLKGSPGALLHVTIQRVVGGAGGCGDDASGENGDALPAVAKTPKRRTTLQSQLSKFEDEDSEKARAAADAMSPVQDGLLIRKPPDMRFPSRRNVPMSADPVGHLHNGSSFDAVSVSGSDGSSGRYTPKISASTHNSFLQDSSNALSPFANNRTVRNPLTSSGDWSGSSAPDASTDGSTSNSGEAGLRGEEDDVDKLRSEIATLTRKVDVSDMELQTLRKQIVKESRRGQDLFKEMSSLREERDALRRECERLRGAKNMIHDSNGSEKRLSDGDDPWSQIEELKQDLSHEKNLNSDLRLQLQKMKESNSELLLAVKDLDESLDKKNREISILQEDTQEDQQEAEYEHALSNVHNSGQKLALSETSSYQEKEDELMLDALAKKRDDISTSELEKKVLELSNEIELYKKDREDIEMQMEQLALDYEILKQENHDVSSRLEQAQLREQLRMQYECSAHLAIISDLEANVESLDNELQTQAKKFEADIAEITSAKVEQEQRAIKAEDSLRKIRWNNAATAERLQEEFKVLSSQVSSAFSANERHLVQARKEVAELQLQKSQLEELLQKAQGDLGSVQDQHRAKVQQLITLVDFKSKEIDRLLTELKSKSDEFHDQKRCDEARLNALSEEMDLLNAKIDELSSERNDLSEKNAQKDKELAGISEKDMQLQDKTAEITSLNKELVSLKDQVKTHLDELHDLKCLKDRKEETIGKLQIDIGSLKLQCDNLKTSLSKKESEKDNLASQVLELRRSLETREEGAKANGQNSDAKNNPHTNNKRMKHNTGSTGSIAALPGTNGQGEDDGDCNGHDMRNAAADGAAKELASLKESSKAVEEELKELHERYSAISLRLAEVEGERQQLVMTVRSLKNSSLR